jgi:hypothetical protein
VLRDDEIHLFAAGLDGAVYSAWWGQAGGWHDWKSIGFGIFTQATPIAAAARGKYIDLFGVGIDDANSAVYWAGWREDEGWRDWQPAGAGLFAQLTPFTAVARGTNLDLFGVGTDGGLYTAWWRAGTAGWEGWNEVGGAQFTERSCAHRVVERALRTLRPREPTVQLIDQSMLVVELVS